MRHERAFAGADGARRHPCAERAGFAVSRTSGSHCRLIHKVDPARKITVPVHSGDLKRGTLRAIIGQAGLTVAEFLQFL